MVSEKIIKQMRDTGFKHAQPTVDNLLTELGTCFVSMTLSIVDKTEKWTVTGMNIHYEKIVTVNHNPVLALCMLWFKLSE